MLHPYQIVSKRRVLYTGLSEEPAPEMELLALLCSIDVWLDTAPAVYGSAEGKMV